MIEQERAWNLVQTPINVSVLSNDAMTGSSQYEGETETTLAVLIDLIVAYKNTRRISPPGDAKAIYCKV